MATVHSQTSQKIVASDRDSGDWFGISVSISGDYAIVGAFHEDEDANGLNTKPQAGSAYIFRKNGSNWIQVQKIVASDRDSADLFGFSVSISGDYAIVGAKGEDEDANGSNTFQGAGSAYIYKNISGTWIQIQKIVASDREPNDVFGTFVSISGDYAIVAAPNEEEDVNGSNTKWQAGSAYVFKNNGGNWTQVQKIVASDRDRNDFFGSSLDISGNYAIVGALHESEDNNGSNYKSQAGSAYIFKNNSGTWTQVQKIVASDRDRDDRFGICVSISSDYAIVGTGLEDEDANGQNTKPEAGSVYIFKNKSGNWIQVQKIVASDRSEGDNFGRRVSISDDYIIVGASLEDEDANGGNTKTLAGSAYIFKNNGGNWTQAQKIVAPDRDSNDLFGTRVAISGNYAIVGAYEEDEDANGSNTKLWAGSAYIFQLNTNSIAKSQVDLSKDISIYPNPNNGNFTLDVSNLNQTFTILSILNSKGKVVYSKEIEKGQAPTERIDLSDKAKGLYFINIISDDEVVTKKMFIF